MAAVHTWFTIMALAAAVTAPHAGAEEYDAPTRLALQSVVSEQIEALGRGDGAAAEAFAAPGVRQLFPDPAMFLAMVRNNYAALINPRSSTFTEVRDSPDGPLQKVTVVAADGSVWSAVYAFEKVDGAWRITGVVLARDVTQQAI